MDKDIDKIVSLFMCVIHKGTLKEVSNYITCEYEYEYEYESVNKDCIKGCNTTNTVSK